jgi:eukaryotic-like serine/threonine-protein kinase
VPESGHQDETALLGAEAERKVVLGRYRLLERLGAGGFGVVWRGHDTKLERDVAVKVVPREHGEPGRAGREALAAARLNHPGIVGLYELGSDDHETYLVSELVNGATVEDLAREGAMSDRDVARIGQALCDALEHAHARGVIHRDVKPANVMVLAEPAAGAGFAKLTDFGVAHLASADGVTATGDVVGTLAYMAPEQAEGHGVTGACDVYSLALVLYEAWSGSNPVRAQSPAATARRVGRPLPSLRSRRRDLPPELCEVVDAALDPDPSYRPAPGELRGVLREMEADLSDEGGLVEPETLERFGITAVRARTRLRTFLHRPEQGGAPEPENAIAPGLAARLGPRLGAGVAAGVLVLVVLESLGPEPPFSAAVAALGVVAVVAMLPRLGWLAMAAGLCIWLAGPEAGRPGTAVVLGAGLAAVPLLLPRAGLLWSVPALAPLLGVIGLAPVFVAVAGLASTPWRRAGLAAAGFGWLALTEVVTGRGLLFGTPDGTGTRSAWEGSALDAAADALWPLLSSPALVPGLVWAAFALLLAVVLRGRWAVVDLAGVTVWVVALVVVHSALGDLLAPTTELSQARGAVAGAVLGGLVAVTVTLLASPVRYGQRGPALP